MMNETYIDEDDFSFEQRGTNDLQQDFWFDEGLYKEWLVFLQGIWNSIEYL